MLEIRDVGVQLEMLKLELLEIGDALPLQIAF
jgi:hypothetical protein